LSLEGIFDLRQIATSVIEGGRTGRASSASDPGAFRLRRRTAMQPKQPRFRGKNAKNAPKYAVFEAFFNVFGPDLPPLAERHFVANS
jgi:hypothetical protein